MGWLLLFLAVCLALAFIGIWTLLLLAVGGLVGYGIGCAIGSTMPKKEGNETNAFEGGIIGAVGGVLLAIVCIAWKIFGAMGFYPGIVVIAVIVVAIVALIRS